MAITVKRVRIPHRLDVGGGGAVWVERVVINGIEVVTGQEQEALFSALSATGMPTFGSPLDGHPEYLLRRIILDSVGDSDAVGYLHWAVEPFGGTPSVSVISESTQKVMRRTNLVPGTRVPIRCASFLDKDLAANVQDEGDAAGLEIEGDNTTFALMFPHRLVSVSELRYGDLPEDKGDLVACVNASQWRGLPRGYWQLDEYTTTVSKFAGYYQRKMAASTRRIEDWSETGVLRNERTGKYINPENGVEFDGINSTPVNLASILALPYQYGIIYNTRGSGLVRVGPYPVTDFASIFGF